MKKYDKIYKIISTANLFLHIILFIFILFISFLPFRENENFFEAFAGFFGSKFSTVQPFFILLLLFAAVVSALISVKRPLFSIAIAVFTFSFFLIVVLPYSFETVFASLFSKMGEVSISNYKIGFHLMNYSSNVIYIDFPFIIFSFVILFLRERGK